MQIATHNGLGIYSNEMQRSVNGLGHYPHGQAGGYYDSRIIPYGYWRSYHPSDARGQFGALGLVDWHVTDTAAAIANMRRQGMSDADITTKLLSSNKEDGSSPYCPWGCDNEKVNAAFQYLATGQFPPGTTFTAVTGKAPTTTASTPSTTPGMSSETKAFYTKVAIAVGAVVFVGGVITVGAIARKRRKGAY